ncbi:MAG TPA: hypothetical protein VGI81_05215 [Tepidisphaeraceae bacterium]|jgi:hypothetical protein
MRSAPVLGKWAIGLVASCVVMNLWLHWPWPNPAHPPLEEPAGWFVANTMWAWAVATAVAAIVSLFQRGKKRWPGLVSLGVLLVVFAFFPPPR